MSRRNSRAVPRSGKGVKGGPSAAALSPGAAAARRRGGAGLGEWFFPLLLIGVGLAAYVNSFDGVFLLDDKVRIVDNPEIRNLGRPWTVMAHSSRPLVQLSLAINYALGGLSVWGYHAFNLTVHLLAGLTLFGVVRRMLESDKLRPRYGRAARWLAGAVAIIWTVHPLQTESVTYIIQRAESMMGLFFLLTLYCGIRGASSPHPRRWYLTAIATCLLGMGSKEVMVVAPLAVLIYDRVFIAPSFKDLFRRRWGFYAGLAATWLVLPALLTSNREEEQLILVTDLTPWRYAMTQPAVIVHYLRLSLWPEPLVTDYAWPLAESVSDVVPWAAVVAAMLAGTALALWRGVWVGFWGSWFFLILAPTSSILPIADAAFEHRMYLPLAAVVVLVVIAGYDGLRWGLRRLAAPAALERSLGVGLVAAAVLALASVTGRRNEVYRSDFAMWTDNVAKRPGNPRAHYTLGNLLGRQGRINEAMARYAEALRLKPDYVDVRVNLASALVSQGKRDEAITHLAEALRIKPNHAEAHHNLGVVLFNEGRIAEATTQFAEAVRLNPGIANAQFSLATVLASQGQLDEAIGHYAAGLQFDPGNARAHSDWGNVLVRQGKLDEAIARYSEALRINPDFVEARNNRAIALTRLGRSPAGP